MTADKTYVRVEDSGAMRVGSSRVSLDSVVIAFQNGEAPETIQRKFPAIGLRTSTAPLRTTWLIAGKSTLTSIAKRNFGSGRRPSRNGIRRPRCAGFAR